MLFLLSSQIRAIIKNPVQRFLYCMKLQMKKPVIDLATARYTRELDQEMHRTFMVNACITAVIQLPPLAGKVPDLQHIRV